MSVEIKRRYRLTGYCPLCGCEFTFEGNDIGWGRLQDEAPEEPLLECPDCEIEQPLNDFKRGLKDFIKEVIEDNGDSDSEEEDSNDEDSEEPTDPMDKIKKGLGWL